MRTYSPFNTGLDRLTTADLGVLRAVAEGWYIEYKRELPNASSLAKSISAFANTYGGWLFIGVTEKSKDEPVAGEFNGIPCLEVDASLQRIRQAVAQHAQPSSHFEAKALFGPDESLALPADRAILVVKVPWGVDAPYVHKDGRIYRRVADSSEPRPENDRFMLDQLWRRSEPIHKEYEDWLNADPIVSRAEDEAPFVRVLLVTDVWRDMNLWLDLSLPEIRQIVGIDAANATSFGIPFDTIYPDSLGYTCRQVVNNDPERLGLTWRFSKDLRNEIIVPIAKFQHSIDELETHLSGYQEADRFIGLLRKHRYNHPTILDLNMLFYVFMGLSRIQKAFMERARCDGRIYAKIKLTGIWRTIPFIDAAYVMDGYEIDGIPLCLDDEIALHRGTSIDSFVHLPAHQEVDEDQHRILMALSLFTSVANSLGISMGEGADPIPDHISEILHAGLRAIEVQTSRQSKV